jgi:dihydroxyacid dehydratase/phosphogluconate dehydratase
MVMGTASTMASIAEAMGMMLPGGATIPAPDSARTRLAEETGRRAVAMVEEDLRPSRIVRRAAIENAIRVCVAIGGSTNGVVHLAAIAGRVGVDLPLDLWDRLSRETPMVASMRPTGAFQMQELDEAGGIPAVMRELAPLLHGDAITVTGKSVGEQAEAAPETRRRDVVASVAKSFAPEGGLTVLTGNLAPRGAIIKHAASTPALLQHRGPAIVFDSVEDMTHRINDPDLPATADSMLVLRNAGPVGGPGMPEAGMIPFPARLLGAGVRDMVRISDARMSGTAYGTVVLHVAPEATVGGPLAAVRDGDEILLDVSARTITLEVADEEIARRVATSDAGNLMRKRE